jgi:hypothetical protein
MYDSIEPPRPPGSGKTSRFIQRPPPRYEFRGRPWPRWLGWLYLISAVFFAVGLIGCIVQSLLWLMLIGLGTLIFGLALRGPS